MLPSEQSQDRSFHRDGMMLPRRREGGGEREWVLTGTGFLQG